MAAGRPSPPLDPTAPTTARRAPRRPDPLEDALPGDIFEVHPMGGHRYNVSLEARRMARARKLLAQLRRELPRKTPEQLIGLIDLAGPMEFWNPIGVRYYVLRDQTPILAAELRRRGEAARPALTRCTGDRRQIFTGSAGPGLTLGQFCTDLLRALDTKKSGAATP